MAYDPHKNFAYSLVATAPSPASSGTSLVVTAAQGALFPTPPFNATVWPIGQQPTSTNAEIVRVTAISTDTLTITRAQESSSARTVIVGDQIAATITNKTLTDVEGLLSNAYKFSAYRNAALSLTAGVITHDTELYDTGGNFDVTTNKGRFTAPVAGFYRFDGAYSATSTGSGQYVFISLLINGVEKKRGTRLDSSAAGVIASIIGVDVQLAATDYVELRANNAVSMALEAFEYTTWFTGHLISQT